MTAFGNLPPQTVVPLGTRLPADLERHAKHAGHGWLYADCAGTRDKAGVMAALASGFKLPKHFGANLDALYDCLTDLEPPTTPAGGGPGWVLVVEHLPDGPKFDTERRDSLLEVFSDAAEHFAGLDVAFRVFWSVSPCDPPAPT
jgi:RNAse (barnase) inhibitor barstar